MRFEIVVNSLECRTVNENRVLLIFSSTMGAAVP